MAGDFLRVLACGGVRSSEGFGPSIPDSTGENGFHLYRLLSTARQKLHTLNFQSIETHLFAFTVRCSAGKLRSTAAANTYIWGHMTPRPRPRRCLTAQPSASGAPRCGAEQSLVWAGAGTAPWCLGGRGGAGSRKAGHAGWGEGPPRGPWDAWLVPLGCGGGWGACVSMVYAQCVFFSSCTGLGLTVSPRPHVPSNAPSTAFLCDFRTLWSPDLPSCSRCT